MTYLYIDICPYRLTEFHDKTIPVLKYYGKKVADIQADDSMDTITNNIRKVYSHAYTHVLLIYSYTHTHTLTHLLIQILIHIHSMDTITNNIRKALDSEDKKGFF
jgi:hypothetical protein